MDSEISAKEYTFQFNAFSFVDSEDSDIHIVCMTYVCVPGEEGEECQDPVSCDHNTDL